MFNDVLKHRSGRVIALARAILAAVFLFAVWMDPGQPAQAPVETYAMLVGWVVTSIALVALIWNNWWLDAKLAAPAHVLDISASLRENTTSSRGITTPPNIAGLIIPTRARSIIMRLA